MLHVGSRGLLRSNFMFVNRTVWGQKTKSQLRAGIMVGPTITNHNKSLITGGNVFMSIHNCLPLYARMAYTTYKADLSNDRHRFGGSLSKSSYRRARWCRQYHFEWCGCVCGLLSKGFYYFVPYANLMLQAAYTRIWQIYRRKVAGEPAAGSPLNICMQWRDFLSALMVRASIYRCKLPESRKTTRRGVNRDDVP